MKQKKQDRCRQGSHNLLSCRALQAPAAVDLVRTRTWSILWIPDTGYSGVWGYVMGASLHVAIMFRNVDIVRGKEMLACVLHSSIEKKLSITVKVNCKGKVG
jgi:hypothetical protein